MVIELFYIMVVILAGFGGVSSSNFGEAVSESRGWAACGHFIWSSGCFGVALALLNSPPSWVIV